MTPNDIDNPFVAVQPETCWELPQTRQFSAAGHLLSQEEIHALTFAYAARRPLLVRGEAGSGKSQLARVAACILGQAAGVARDRCADLLFVETIHARYEAQDLLYKVDHVERLADAQLQRLDETYRRYVHKGKLWQALLALEPGGPTTVLLIDEIDKADADVPNALLEVLGNRSFTVPMLTDLTVSAAGRLPMIVITTNEERELPPAFVRRCAVLDLNPPEQTPEEFAQWLVHRGQTHGHLQLVKDDAVRAAGEKEPSVLKRIAMEVWADRTAAVRAGFFKVGLAEFIDLVHALDDLTCSLRTVSERRATQLKWLDKLKRYALQKGVGQQQAVRPPAQSPADG